MSKHMCKLEPGVKMLNTLMHISIGIGIGAELKFHIKMSTKPSKVQPGKATGMQSGGGSLPEIMFEYTLLSFMFMSMIIAKAIGS